MKKSELHAELEALKRRVERLEALDNRQTWRREWTIAHDEPSPPLSEEETLRLTEHLWARVPLSAETSLLQTDHLAGLCARCMRPTDSGSFIQTPTALEHVCEECFKAAKDAHPGVSYRCSRCLKRTDGAHLIQSSTAMERVCEACYVASDGVRPTSYFGVKLDGDTVPIQPRDEPT